MNERIIITVKGKELLAKVRQVANQFPVVTEAVDQFGHTSFRVKDKPFIMMGEKDETTSLSIKTLKTTQQLLLQQPDRFFKTPYIGQHGWTSLFTNIELNWEEIEEYIKEAYLQTAPKKLSMDVLEALQNE